MKPFLIYVNGDSFAAGVGHGDYLIPGYPGLQTSFSVCDVQNQWYETKDKALRNNTALSLEVMAEEKNRCWPTVLQNLLTNTKIINCGVGASSIDSILDRTLSDLSFIKDVDAVIIQHTAFTRIGFPTKNNSNHHSIRDVLLGITSSHDPVLEGWIIDNSSDISLAMRYVKALATIKHTVISLTGKPPIIVDSCLQVTDPFIWTVPVIADLIHLLGLTDCFPAKCKMSDFSYDGAAQFPCGHYGPVITNDFAAQIADTYFATRKKKGSQEPA